MNTQHIGEKARNITNWLSYQNDSLSYGLRTVADAERLYDYWQSHADTLPEFADADEDEDLAPHRIAAIGYDPLGPVVGDAPIDEEIAETVAALENHLRWSGGAIKHYWPGPGLNKMKAKHAATLRALERIKSTK